jgi:hypothetical protein
MITYFIFAERNYLWVYQKVLFHKNAQGTLGIKHIDPTVLPW